MITRYRANDISLGGLANNIEGLVAALEINEPLPWAAHLGELQVAFTITAELYTFTDSPITEEIQRDIERLLTDITTICVENLPVQGD
jgi:hypothetical protein